MQSGFEIRSLSERYADAVLRYMLSAGSDVKFSDLKFIVNNFPTLEKLMDSLESDGLIITRKTLRPYKTNYASLTPIGQNVARKLQDIENIMNGTMPNGGDALNCSASEIEGSKVR